MTDAILEITDGTVRVDLINPSSGFHLTNWIPQITDYKGGGVFQNPPLADWRQLRTANWDTAQENFGLTVNGQNPNNVALILQQLRQLLEKANAYWTTDWQNDPVWVVAKAKCETETRYCLIVKGRLGNDQNYYQDPFKGTPSTMQDLPLVIERRAWMDNIPGVGNATPISNLQTFNSVTFGTVDSAGDREPVTGLNELFLSNRRANQNFTHIFNFDASGASFSANLLNTIPMTLFPASTAVGDIVYFGIQSSLTDSGPIFAPVVFDLSVPASSTTSFTIAWERWTGAAWSSFFNSGVQNQLDVLGSGSLNWQPNDQVVTAVNGVTGWWIRARIAALTGTFTRPVQQNKNPYIANWPYFEIQSSAISGDIVALANLLLLDGGSDAGAPIDLNIWDVIIGLRSVSRGENFTAYLNASDQNNPTGITVTARSGAFASNVYAPSGEVLQWTPGGTSTDTSVIDFLFDESIINEFYGKYRVFVRAEQTSGIAEDIELRVRLNAGTVGNIFTTEYKAVDIVSGVHRFGVIDFGQITIPTNKLKATEIFENFTIDIDANVLATGGTLVIVDLVLIPVDEFSIIAMKGDNAPTDTEGQYLELDSIVYPKHHVRSILKEETNNYVISIWHSQSNSQLIAQANERQRYWVSFNTNRGIMNVGINTSIQMQDVQRYLSLRGEQ